MSPIQRFGSARVIVIGTVALVAFATGCAEDDSDVAPQPVSFATFNTALVAHAGNVEARLQTIAHDLPDLDADVICLQEVWQPEHTRLLVSAVEKDFPNAHWSVDPGSGTVGCSQTETELLIGCMHARCAEVDQTAIAGCAVANCANEYAAVSKGCQQCVLANQTLALESISANCQSVDAQTVAYENQNGLVLLSRYPLKSKDYLPMVSSLGDRGVLYAQIDTPLLPTVDLFCTHLAATLTEVTYSGVYGSWEGERAAQIGSLSGFMKEKQQNSHTGVVMGDMNCGPESADIAAEDAVGFERLLALGLEAPYLGNGDERCTYCADNALVGNSGALDVLIDHVLFSHLPDSTHFATRRVFDDPVVLSGDVTAAETFRSDHYGNLVTVLPRGAD